MLKRIMMGAICLMLLVQPVTAKAEVISNPIVNVGSVYNGEAQAILTITSSGTAKVTVKVTGKIGQTTKITSTIYLQRYNKATSKWVAVKTWTPSASSANLMVNRTYQLSKSGKYRVRAVAKAWNGSNSEKITKNSSSVTY